MTIETTLKEILTNHHVQQTAVFEVGCYLLKAFVYYWGFKPIISRLSMDDRTDKDILEECKKHIKRSMILPTPLDIFMMNNLSKDLSKKNKVEKYKIIIADDSRTARTIIADAVAAYKPNIEICEVENGKELIERIRKERFDLTIVDDLMSIMTGLEAITEIRNLYSKEKLPICMLTTLDIKEEAMKKGVTDYIMKDRSFDSHLKEVLKKYI